MGMCKTCPFNYFSEESERVQNYGCIPTPGQIVDQSQVENKNWACHHTSDLCAGFAGYCKRNNIPFDKTKELIIEQGVHF